MLVRAGLLGLALVGPGHAEASCASRLRPVTKVLPDGTQVQTVGFRPPMEGYDAVFLGRLESVTAVPVQWENRRLLRFRTQTWWKGTPAQEVEVQTSGSNEMRDWAPGSVLVVFASGEPGALQSSICAGNTDDLAIVQQLGGPIARFDLPEVPVSGARAAVRAGDGQALRKALASGDDPNDRRPDGTLLELALAQCDPALVGPLASAAGVEPPWESLDGLFDCPANDNAALLRALAPALPVELRQRRLNGAIAGQRNDEVRLWLEAGGASATGPAPGRPGRPPLVVAYGFDNREAQTLLTEAGATVDRDVLVGAAVANGRLEPARALVLEAELAPDVATFVLSRAPLHREVVASLLAQGADPSGDGLLGQTPMATAAKLGHWDVVTLLAEAGARDDEALVYAAGRGSLEQLDALLDLGLQPDARSVEVSMGSDNPEILVRLLEAGAPLTPALLKRAAIVRSPHAVQALTQAGVRLSPEQIDEVADVVGPEIVELLRAQR